MSNDPDRNTGRPAIAVPGNARQHATAGPYSPVLMVDARRLVVLSGQVAVDLAGQLVGDSIEAQTRATLANCERHLADAGCALSDAFKVNVYLANLEHWGRFNAIYEEILPPPFPVRTAVQAVLLPGFLVEVEMWAVGAED